MKRVGVALISDRLTKKILIGKRASSEPYAGFWEFPGGKLEKGETPQQAIQRELMEELNVKSTVLDKFCEIPWSYPNGLFNLLIYHTEIDISTLKLTVHDKIEWVSVENAFKYNMLPSNMLVLSKLKTFFN